MNRWAVPKSLDASAKFGLTQNFTIMGKTYKTAFCHFDGRSTVFDGPFVIKIYTKKDGFISFQNLGSMLPVGTIYNLMP